MHTNNLIQKLVDDNHPITAMKPLALRFLMWLAPTLLILGLFFSRMKIRSDIDAKLGQLGFHFELFCLLIIGFWGAFLALNLSIPGTKFTQWAKGLLLFFMIGWGSLMILSFQNSFFTEGLKSFQPDPHFICGLLICIGSIIPSALLFKILNNAFPIEINSLGFLAGISNASLSAIGMKLICPLDKPMHILSWHFVPVFLIGLMGIFIQRKISKLDENKISL